VNLSLPQPGVFSPGVVFVSVWLGTGKILQVTFDHDNNDDNNNSKQKDPQILIGNNPFGADCGKLVLLQFCPAKEGTTSTVSSTDVMVEVVTMSIPQVQEYTSLEEWLQQTVILSSTEYYLELLWSTYLHETLDIDTSTPVDDDKRSMIMDCVDENVHDYCQFADDKCKLAAWRLNFKQWGGNIVLPVLCMRLQQEYKW
jgi:hypothetical protein